MAVELAICISGKVADFALVPIGRHFGYLLYFNANVETLRDQVRRLDDLRHENERKVETAENNVEEIRPAVNKWLSDAEKIHGEAQIIIRNWENFPTACVSGCCLNLKSRYVLSRSAKKKSVDIVKLLDEGKFEVVSIPRPPMPLIGSSSTITFGSRELIINEIIKNLKDDKINMVGICGMAGVGKTTTLKEVHKRLEEKKIFNEYAETVVSQKRDPMKIQNDIAEMLGLKLEEGNPNPRAGRLKERLRGKKVLIMLDDVWEDFILQDLGITLQGAENSCKVLFTSRRGGLWNDLRTKRDVSLGILSDAEAWDLFWGKTGDFLEDKAELQPVAREIVRECGGLPLALVTLGCALREKSKYFWDDTLQKLSGGYPTKIPGVSAKVHRSLQLSYDYLEEEEAKSFFLLCCLFEEDFDIPIEDLVGIGLGLRLFAGLNCLELARNRVFSLVEQLQGCHLLLPSWKGHKFTKMHDVVRDVAKWIAFEEKRALVVENATELTAWQEQGVLNDFIWISVISDEVRKLPAELKSSQVKLFRCSNAALDITNPFFEGMGELRVLHIQGMELPNLPSSLRLLSKLRTLSLRKCMLKGITLIGDLPNLQILNFAKSTLEELPREMGNLSKLESLDLTKCSKLITISPSVISSLRQLQELYMMNTNIDWESGENEEGRSASLRELKSLSNLHILHIEMNGVNFLPRSSLFSNLNLKKYKIGICRKDRYLFESHEKLFSMYLSNLVPLEGDIKFLAMNAEELHLGGEFAKDLVHEIIGKGSQGLKQLVIREINNLEHLTNAMDTLVNPLVLSTVEGLRLCNLDNLKRISRGPLAVGSFQKLKKLDIQGCRELKNAFQLSVAKELVHLTSLFIQICGSMEEVVWKESEEDTTSKIQFPRLTKLGIYRLPRLTSFCTGIEEIGFPQLRFLSLVGLEQSDYLFSRESSNSHSIFPDKVSLPSLQSLFLEDLRNMKKIWCGQLPNGSFGNLSDLTINWCYDLCTVFTPFIASNLVHLRKLAILNCPVLEVVVAGDGDGWEAANILPGLQELRLAKLPALESFCHVRDLEYPMLESLVVDACPKLITFSPGSLRTPNLSHVETREEDLWEGDLNSTMLYLHERASPSIV